MKKLFVIMISLALALGASAQRFHGGGGYHYGGPRVSVGIGAYAPFYPSYGFYSPYYGYPRPYGYGSGYGYNSRPSKLSLKVEDIKNDYNDRIWSAKHDTSLSRKERKKLVHELRHERDDAVNDAKRNYYKY
jgi:hypothetical protein